MKKAKKIGIIAVIAASICTIIDTAAIYLGSKRSIEDSNLLLGGGARNVEVRNGELFWLQVPVGDITDSATVRIAVPEETSKEQTVAGIVSTGNKSPEKNTQVTLVAAHPFRLQAVGQAYIYKTGATDDEIYSSHLPGNKPLSLSLRNEDLTGDGVNLDESYSNWTVKLQLAVAFYEDYKLDTEISKVNDKEVEVVIRYTNTSKEPQEGVRITSDETIDLMDAIPGSATYSSSVDPNKTIEASGESSYCLGTCEPGEEVTIKYHAKILDDAEIDEQGRDGVIITECYVGQDWRMRVIGFNVSKDRAISDIRDIE